jgi:hypothetical protein
MAKSLSGADVREGTTIVIGDNRYGLREEYDPTVAAATKKYYKEGDKLTVKEVKNPLLQSVRTEKPK